MENTAFSTGDRAPVFEIFHGFWTNWSYGPIFGRVLTISRQNADLVMAFTGVFVTFVGVRFWRILSLACHRFFSSSCPQGALYHQRQAILRNSSSADSTLTTFVGLFWAWRQTSERVFRRLYILFLLSVLCSAAFIIAGGFSSRISTLVGTEVLLQGAACSSLLYYVVNSTDTREAYAASNAWSTQSLGDAFNYAQQCYFALPSSPGTSCVTFVRPQISGRQNKSASCPFQESLCREMTGNLLLDSGYLDSHSDFGLNSPPNERILIRNVLHCAPLATEGNMYTDNHDWTVFDYGGYIGPDFEGNPRVLNYTYLIQDYTRTPLLWTGHGDPAPGEADYRLTRLVSTTINNQTSMAASSFIPDERLFRPDADIVLYFLSSPGVLSTEPSGDKWFRTTFPVSELTLTGGDGRTDTLYGPDVPASPLACASQYQFCSADQNHCGPLASKQDAFSRAAPLFGTTSEMLSHFNITEPVPGRFQRLNKTLQAFPIQFITSIGLGVESLLAHKTLSMGMQGLLPDDQWQREMTAWWATSLAGLQTFFVQTAAGVTFPGLEYYRGYEPLKEFEKDMCKNQKVLSTTHASFSVFGISFVYVSGAVIIILSYTLEPCLRCCHRRHLKRHEDHGLEHTGTYRDVEWTANSTLQLLRFAHENAGVEPWTRCTDDIPVLDDAARQLCVLDLQDPAHPRLSRQKQTTTSLVSAASPHDDMQQVDASSQEIDPLVDDEPPQTPAADDTPPSEDETIQSRPAAPSGTHTEAAWLECPRPLSPLGMPEFSRD